MDLTLGAEQEAVRDAIRGVLADRQPSARVRAVMASEPPVDAALWREAGELGWFGLALPEAAGGAGYDLPEAMLLFQELGRSLAPGPWLGTVLAARTGMPGPEASMIRLFFSELVQRIDVLAMEILGSSAVTGFAADGAPHDEWAERYLTGLSQTIGGGTKEIQRNIIGERVLGLPR